MTSVERILEYTKVEKETDLRKHPGKCISFLNLLTVSFGTLWAWICDISRFTYPFFQLNTLLRLGKLDFKRRYQGSACTVNFLVLNYVNLSLFQFKRHHLAGQWRGWSNLTTWTSSILQLTLQYLRTLISSYSLHRRYVHCWLSSTYIKLLKTMLSLQIVCEINIVNWKCILIS